MNNTVHNKEKVIRGYYRFSKAWYATDRDVERSTVMLGMYYPDNGTIGEISLEWETIGDQKVPVLTAYDDSWKVLPKLGDLMKEMARWNDKNITEEQFVQLLNKTGFTDLTLYHQELKHGKQPRTVISFKNKRLKK